MSLQPRFVDSVPSRRDFLKTSMAAAAGAATLGGLSLARSAHAAGSDVLRIGLIGCGDRGPGAAVNAMSVDPGVRLVAMTDIFPERVRDRRERVKKAMTDLAANRGKNGPEISKEAGPNQVQVDDAHCFSGLDGYKHVIESADVVLIACSAKYHPLYMRAAIEAGKHVFVEKPHAIDPVGVREVTAACELAKQKGLERHVGADEPLRPRIPGGRPTRPRRGHRRDHLRLRTLPPAALPTL